MCKLRSNHTYSDKGKIILNNLTRRNKKKKKTRKPFVLIGTAALSLNLFGCSLAEELVDEGAIDEMKEECEAQGSTFDERALQCINISVNPAPPITEINPEVSFNPIPPEVEPEVSVNPLPPEVEPEVSVNPLPSEVEPEVSVNPLPPEVETESTVNHLPPETE